MRLVTNALDIQAAAGLWVLGTCATASADAGALNTSSDPRQAIMIVSQR